MVRAGITLQIATTHLTQWLEAELVLTTGGQSYQIGSRMLTRANLREIRNTIKFWSDQIASIETAEKYKGRNRVQRAIPRDL